MFELEIRNSIAILRWDDPDSSSNVFSSKAGEELKKIHKEIEEKNIQILILISTKPNIFISGADIKEIESTHTPEDFENFLRKGHELLNDLEKSNIVKIAAIHGACLGGGLELVLTFDYRLASDSPVTKLGLPEVKLGLLPGLGGCIRLPRLVGLQQSLKMILNGSLQTAKKALKIGLVDEVVSKNILEKRALDLAQEILEGKKKKDSKQKYKEKKPYVYFLERLLNPIIFYLTKKAVVKETKKFYPAPLTILQIIKKTYFSSNMDQSIEEEIKGFLKVAMSSESRHLVRLFLLMEECKKNKDIFSKEGKFTPIKKLGVLGSGIMGGGIAYLAADKNFKVRLKDVYPESLSKALKEANTLWKKQVSRRMITKYEHQKRFHNLSLTLTYAGFSNLDIVIEAIAEDMHIKKAVIKEISPYMTEKNIFVSNTSSLSLSEMAKVYPYPNRLAGFHFFNPVYKMPLIEVIKTNDTDITVIKTLLDFSKKLGKVPVLVNDSPGFVVNRILIPYLIESLFILEQVHHIAYVDYLFTHSFGFPMGPFRLMDEVGLDICEKVIQTFQKSNLNIFVPDNWQENISRLGLGKKSKKGFYIYNSSSPYPNPEVQSMFKKKKNISAEDIIKRGIYSMIHESLKVLREGVIEKAEHLDLAMILGIGFPPFLGGPIHHGAHLSWDHISSELKRFYETEGERFSSDLAWTKVKETYSLKSN